MSEISWEGPSKITKNVSSFKPCWVCSNEIIHNKLVEVVSSSSKTLTGFRWHKELYILELITSFTFKYFSWRGSWNRC